MSTDFGKITPCGGNCEGCKFFIGGECEGCIKTGGKCVKLWQNGCEIWRCCNEHKVKFCGLCEKFPCDWIAEKLEQWDNGGIERMKELAAEYRRCERDRGGI